MAAAQLYLPYRVAAKPTNVGSPGAQMFVYAPGTTTLRPVYASSALTTQLSNPVVADGAGRFPNIWLDNALTYKLVIKDKAGATLDTFDPYIPGQAPDASALQPYQDAAEAAATAAASSASDAGTSATASATSATASATSATAAATSASGAASSATAASGSATSASGSAGLAGSSLLAISAAIATYGAIVQLPVVAATRTVLAGLATSKPALLTESGRVGTFVFDSSNLSAKVTLDTAQGVYIAPSSDATGASGAWVRNYVGPLYLEWFGGGPSVTDNKTAWEAATALGPCSIFLKPSTTAYSFSKLVFPISVYLWGAGRGASTILITGDGGGTPAAGVNGGIQLFLSRNVLADVTLKFNNPSLECLLNISGVVAGGRSNVYRVDLEPSGVTASQMNCIAVCLGNLVEFEWDQGQIGVSPGFKQDMKFVGFMNGCKIKGVTFRPHSLDIPNGVFHTAYSQIEYASAGAECIDFDTCTFEIGPNTMKATGQGVTTIRACYFGDSNPAKNNTGWLPSQAIIAGDFMFPSASTTGSIDIGVSTTTLNLTSASAAFAGQSVTVIGAGAAGANLSTKITALAGTVATISPAASTTVASVGVYWQNYSGHIYICKTAGTTDSAPPTWPTTFQDEVTDGTVVWKEHGAGAWIDMGTAGGTTGKHALEIGGCLIAANPIGISVIRSGSVPGTLDIHSNRFLGTTIAAYLDGPSSAAIHSNKFDGYAAAGFIMKATSSGSTGYDIRGNSSANVTAPAADFVVSTNSNFIGGSHQGATTLAGIGASRFGNDQTGATAAFSHPGPITSSNATGGIGYATGAGGTVTQLTSKSTSVTLNKAAGAITMHNAALASATLVSFTLTNSAIAADDNLVVRIKSGNSTVGTYRVWAEGNSAGSRTICVENRSAGSLSEALILGFVLIKGASS